MPKKKKSKARKKSSKKRKPIKRKSKIKKTRVKKKKRSAGKKEDNLTTELIIKTKPEWIKSGLTNKSQYQKKYSESIKNNNAFWKKEGKRISWIKPYKKIKDIK